MASAQLSASVRADTGKGAARSLRREGQIPGVIYGHAREAQSLAVPAREFERLLERIEAGSTVIELALDGATTKTLIREIQRHPFKKQILHVDFQELVAGEKVTVKVPLTLSGTSEGVRLGGGILDQTMRELSILVDPSNIPAHIDVDISTLGLGKSLHVSDLQLPEGVEALDDEGATVCVISAPRVAEETPAAEGGAEPEVIRAKKPDDDAKGGDKK